MRIVTKEGKTWPGCRANSHQGDIGSPGVDFVKLGVQPQDVPAINAMIRRVEESMDILSVLTAEEAKNLVEILDKVHIPHDVPCHALNSRQLGYVFRERWWRLEGQIFQDPLLGLLLLRHPPHVLLRTQRGTGWG